MSTTSIVRNGDLDVIDVTLTLDTNEYASGDVLAVPAAVVGVFRGPSDVRRLVSVVLLDEDDQAQAVDLMFFNATATLGTINGAVSISDADARKVIGVVKIATGDYVDLVNNQVAFKTGLDLPLKASSTGACFLGAVLRSGTPTYTAAGIKIKLGFA
jgi:hypothetical protein